MAPIGKKNIIMTSSETVFVPYWCRLGK